MNNKKVKNYQVLDDIFPNERRIRSLIGGTENTFEQLKALFIELGQENFAAEFNDIFYQN